ncbi:MAG TPA: adenine phosphoribosyltransferase [bacterium]|nr:adenine phosphoribosyltransferase [bacterium]
MKKLQGLIRTIPDFPKEGILFRDITTLLEDGESFKKVVDLFKSQVPSGISKVAAIESRGFIFGGALAFALGAGFVPIRKSGKLPWEKIRIEYDLEYGTDVLEMHRDAVKEGERVILVDDLLATGGTAKAACSLVEKAGGRVEKVLFLIELNELKGVSKLKNYNVFSLLRF